MSDLFHEEIPESYIRQVFEIIKNAPQHTLQILTKRVEKMEQFFKSYEAPKISWLGVSVENKKHGGPGINNLRRVKATIRFLSIEPLLEDLGNLDLTNIHWIIVGGESGPKARPMKSAWVERIKQQCEDQNISFFFKQWGGWGADGIKRSKKANGRLLLGLTWDSMPDLLRPSYVTC